MTRRNPLHAVPAHPARLRPEQRRRTAVVGRRPRVVVLSHEGAGPFDADAVRRLAQVADVAFHRLATAPDTAAAARLLRRADVLATTATCLPMLDEELLATVPGLRGVVVRGFGRDRVAVRHLGPHDEATGVATALATELLGPVPAALPLAG